MERTAILATMGELKLYGMRAAFDAIITTAVACMGPAARSAERYLARADAPSTA